ncbi:hypothetical protein Tco_1283219 [Tanacetum coccineum]
MPRRGKRNSNRSLVKLWSEISASDNSFPRSKFNIFVSTCSRKNMCRMSMSLERECWTLFAAQSNSTFVITYRGFNCKTNTRSTLSWDRFPKDISTTSNMASIQPSVVDIAVLRCFFDDQLTNLSPRNCALPDVACKALLEDHRSESSIDIHLIDYQVYGCALAMNILMASIRATGQRFLQNQYLPLDEIPLQLTELKDMPTMLSNDDLWTEDGLSDVDDEALVDGASENCCRQRITWWYNLSINSVARRELVHQHEDASSCSSNIARVDYATEPLSNPSHRKVTDCSINRPSSLL